MRIRLHFAFIHLRITSNIWLLHILGQLIAIIVNHPFIWEKQNENGKSVSNGHLPFLKYLPFVFAVCQIQPFGAAVVAQKSIRAFYSIATEKFQINLFPPKQQSKMFEGATYCCWRTLSARGVFWNCHFGFLSITLLIPSSYMVLYYLFLFSTLFFPSPAATTADSVCTCHSLVCDLWLCLSWAGLRTDTWLSQSAIGMWLCKASVCNCVFREVNQSLWFALEMW